MMSYHIISSEGLLQPPYLKQHTSLIFSINSSGFIFCRYLRLYSLLLYLFSIVPTRILSSVSIRNVSVLFISLSSVLRMVSSTSKMPDYNNQIQVQKVQSHQISTYYKVKEMNQISLGSLHVRNPRVQTPTVNCAVTDLILL